MKTCLICGTSAADVQATCPNDGEASWSAVAKAPVLEEPIDAPAAEEPARKRGRR
jgi:hypothetical protein